jgi:hypothetical protein
MDVMYRRLVGKELDFLVVFDAIADSSWMCRELNMRYLTRAQTHVLILLYSPVILMKLYATSVCR